MTRKKMKKGLMEKLLLFTFVLLFFLLVGFAGRWFYNVDNSATIRLGVTIEGVDVGGMSIEDAESIITDWTHTKSENPLITVSSQIHTNTLPVGQGLSFNVKRAVKDAYNIGRKGNFARNYVETIMTKYFSEDITVGYSLYPDGIIEFAEAFAQKAYKEGENAQLLGAKLSDDGNIAIQLKSSVYAQTIDAISVYNTCILTYDEYGLDSTVTMQPTYVPPPVTDNTILDMAIPNVQFSYRPSNITVASMEINNVEQEVGAIVLLPGESFSLKSRLEKNPKSIYNSINLPTIIMGAALRAGLTVKERVAVIADLPIGDGQSVITGENADLVLLNETDTPVIIWVGADSSHIYANASCFYDEGVSHTQISSIQKGNDYIASSIEVWRVYYSDKSRERTRELLWEQSID